jgi:hypothetical protein
MTHFIKWLMLPMQPTISEHKVSLANCIAQGPGLPLWTLELLPLPDGQDTYPFLQEA